MLSMACPHVPRLFAEIHALSTRGPTASFGMGVQDGPEYADRKNPSNNLKISTSVIVNTLTSFRIAYKNNRQSPI